MQRYGLETVEDAGTQTLDSPPDKEKAATRLLQAAIVTASLLMVTLSVNLQVPLYGPYAEQAGYGSGLVAVTFSAYVVGLIPVLILLGGVSDRIGRKPALLLGLGAAFLANLLIVLDPGMQTLLKVRVLQGIGVGLSLGAATAYLAEILDNSPVVASLAGITVTIGLGSGALLTSLALLHEQSMAPLSYFAVTAATSMCFLAMLTMPKKPALHSNSIIRLPQISRQTMDFCIAIFLAWSLTGIIIATVPGELKRHGLTGWSGVLVFLAIGIGAFFQPLARRMAARHSLRIGYALFISGFLLLLGGIHTGALSLILLGSACSGASSFGFIYLGGLAAVVDNSGKEKARAVSGYFLFAYLGLGVPCIFIGFMSDSMGLFESLAYAGSAVTTIALLLHALARRTSTP